MKPVAPLNNYIVTLDQKYYDTVVFESGVKLHFDPSWQPQEHAMLEATVVSAPEGIIDRFDYRDMSIGGATGDRMLVRYDLVFNYFDQPDRDSPIHKNLMLLYEETAQRFQEYWVCDVQKVFAIKRNNSYLMQNKYVMLEPVTETKGDFSDLIIRPDSLKTQTVKHKAIIKAIEPNENNLKAGDMVYLNGKVVQCYQINRQSFHICKQSHIVAKAV